MLRDIKAAICVAILLSALYGASEAMAYVESGEFDRGFIAMVLPGAD